MRATLVATITLVCLCGCGGGRIGADRDALEEIEDAKGVLLKAGEQFFSPMAAEAEASALARELGVSRENLPKEPAKLSMTKFAKGFILQEEEAKAILSGQFNDKANSAKIKKAREALTEVGTRLPVVCRYVMSPSGRPKGGAQLEFATRLLEGYLASLQVKEQNR